MLKLFAICAFACAAGACTAKSEQPTKPATAGRSASDPRGLKGCTLPDVSNAVESVQTQLREQYAKLAPKVESAGTPAPDLAAAYGDLGKLLIAAEFLDAAELCLANAQALEPTAMRWAYYLGHVERLKNEPARAAAFFEQALELDPRYAPALVWLGEMYLVQNRTDAAEPLFARVLASEPQSASALYGLGRSALAKQDYGQAITYLERALALAPDASRIQYPLAMAYRGSGDARRADAHLKRRGEVEVPTADPLMAELGGLLQNAAAYELRGSEALGRRQWADAVQNLRKAAALAPDNASTRLNLGTALYLTGDADGALEQFAAAARLSPGLSKAHYGIGVIMEARGRDREAIEAFSAAVRSDPGSVEARLQLADALRASGRSSDSLRQYAEVIKISPGVSQARFGYAMALVRLGRYEEARARLADGVKTYADQPGFAHALARLLAAAPDDRVRDGRQALTLMQDLLKKQRSIGLAETMAMTLAELGQFDEAVKWQREALSAARATQRDAVPRLEDNLTLYEAHKPCRTPWRDDDPVFHPRPAG